MNKRNEIIASVFFVLALIVVTHTSAYFYIESQYPTSENILRNKKSDGKLNFKTEEAKEAGYSEKEIYEYLSTRNEEISAKYYKNIIVAETASFLCYFLHL